MATLEPASMAPEVSIIVPARNEEASLGACLESLVGQEGMRSEIIVVDDNSSDHTRDIALTFPSVQIVDAGALPAGWTGKNNAVAAGARHARGEWLLFTDADTVHRPGSLARALQEAKVFRAALLSYSPEQEVHGFWEKALMPVIFAELACTYRPRDVCNPKSPVAAANGQYLLISRIAYDAVGGHAAIADSLLEDVILATKVKGSHRKIRFRYGADAVRTRMYRSFQQLCEGWTKNLALLFPNSTQLAAKRAAEFVTISGGVLAGVAALILGRPKLAGTLGGLAGTMYAVHRKRIARANFSREANFLALFGLPLFSYLLLRSRLSHEEGRVAWKGRLYQQPRAGETDRVASEQPQFTSACWCSEIANLGRTWFT
ncbi:MAG TPA: glycosyltransferase family 2 protein [Terriglobales bacterium]|nr:glycosyltransferase family 2 protein [Terriglobales bacterium]